MPLFGINWTAKRGEKRVITAADHDCGPVIFGLERPDHDMDAVEESRSVVETLRLVHRFTSVEEEPAWCQGMPCPSRRTDHIMNEWRVDHFDTPSSEGSVDSGD